MQQKKIDLAQLPLKGRRNDGMGNTYIKQIQNMYLISYMYI